MRLLHLTLSLIWGLTALASISLGSITLTIMLFAFAIITFFFAFNQDIDFQEEANK